jgi:hypothetical protein
LDIYFYCFNQNIFIYGMFVPAHSHLDVISGGLWQLLVEPWRVVEGAACALRTTASAIPQRIVIVKYAKVGNASTACITEIVIAYKGWRQSSLTRCGSVSAGA